MLPFSCCTFEKLTRKVYSTSSALPSLAIILTKYVTFAIFCLFYSHSDACFLDRRSTIS
jgi:hypothetical protein